ncbi:MAG TPA: fused MFS/spermidine synthase [Egibacteraceae bacterium]|nr:fused MFS/spermidine synthase [Egibacteraceae bacterium]
MTSLTSPGRGLRPPEVGPDRSERWAPTAMVLLFGVASFLSAGLLFLVQPMAGKLVLPLFGGSASVWNAAMLFFQTVLLAGYAYAHVSTQRLGLRRQPLLHAAALLVPLLVLPIALPTEAPPPEGVMPALWLLQVLVLMVGAPFLLVSTSGPLLQRWFSATDHHRAGDPYFLYAAGNAGSLLALLAYPLLVEPALSLEAQTRLWSFGYGLFAILTLACVVALRRRRAPTLDPDSAPAAGPATGEAPLGLRRQLTWVLLAFMPSSLMLGVTSFLSTDIAAFPLLWVVPLALYLLTFIVAFGQRRPLVALYAGRLLPAAVLAVALTLVVPLPTGLEVALHLLLFLPTVALAAHGRLAQDRPTPAHLTRFYLLVSTGGALGGLFNGLLAPVTFDSVVEYPLVIAAAVFVLVGPRPGESRSAPVARPRRALTAALVVGVLWLLPQGVERLGPVAAAVLVGLLLGARRLVAMVADRRPLAFAVGTSLALASATLPASGALHTERTFFGVARVEAEGDRHVLVHGTTIHGWQDRRPGQATVPQSYYHRSGPIGEVFAAYGRQPAADEVAIIGLGTGGLAAYGRAGQTLTFYEIDEAIVDIATDPQLFSFLHDTPAEVDVVLGDGRLSLADAPAHHFGIIALDAFSSDAIPVHLLTTEAVALYRSKLAPGGVIALHISNRHLDLGPVVAGVAEQQGLPGLVRHDAGDADLGKLASTWVVLAENAETLAPLAARPGWRPLVAEPGQALVWTDDFSDVVRVLRWR